MSNATALPPNLSPTPSKILCRTCGRGFEEWGDLARHIVTEKKTHKNKKNRAWALAFLSRKINKTEIKRVADDPTKEKTEIGDENRENMKRKLSGETKMSNAICPKCKRVHHPLLEIEYISSNYVWRINNKMVKLCGGCVR